MKMTIADMASSSAPQKTKVRKWVKEDTAVLKKPEGPKEGFSKDPEVPVFTRRKASVLYDRKK
jgi:hypothetical protein